MSKFKVGDKVRIIADYSPGQSKRVHIGKCFTITRYYDPIKSFYGKDSYEFDETHYAWFDDELELVKPKFNYEDYPGMYVMHVTTKEQAEIFIKYMTDVMHLFWFASYYHVHGENTCYEFNDDCYSRKQFYINRGYTILEFEDFDWSDFTMKKEFTKADLKNGDIVKISDDSIGIICLDTNTIILKRGFDRVSDLTDDLKFRCYSNNSRIVAVRRPNQPGDCQFTAFEHEWGELVYERKEVEEMTLEEVCKALGKEIKIVKEK